MGKGKSSFSVIGIRCRNKVRKIKREIFICPLHVCLCYKWIIDRLVEPELKMESTFSKAMGIIFLPQKFAYFVYLKISLYVFVTTKSF